MRVLYILYMQIDIEFIELTCYIYPLFDIRI